MQNEFDYYLIGSDNTPSIPLLRPGDDMDDMFLMEDFPVELPDSPLELCFRSPVPAKPRMADFHLMPSSVFSQKIYEVLQPMNIEGMQLIPATVIGKKGEEYENYWIAHIYNKIECIDREHSAYEISPLDGWVKNIRKLFLDTDKLAKTPLEKRLVFLPKEDRSKRIYHKIIVDAIMAINPIGVKFYPILQWHEGIQFE